MSMKSLKITGGSSAHDLDDARTRRHRSKIRLRFEGDPAVYEVMVLPNDCEPIRRDHSGFLISGGEFVKSPYPNRKFIDAVYFPQGQEESMAFLY